MLAEKTIDEEIGEDWKAIQEKFAVKDEPDNLAPITAEAETAETEAVKADNVTAEVPRETERPRDESGKFTKGSVQNAAPKEPVQASQNAVGEVEQQAETNAIQRDINRPPSTWKPLVRQEWDKLTPSVRAEIHRREADFQNGQAQLLPDARLGSEMRKVTEPYRMVIESNYGSPEKAMSAFLQTATALQMGSPQQKLQTLIGLSQQFGIDLSPLSQQGQPQQQQPQQSTDPRVDQLLAQMRQQEQQRQQQELQQLSGVADSWMAEKDASGNPLRPYIGDVVNEMTLLIPQIKQANPHFSHAQILEQAYDRAVWANPDTRAALQGQQQSELQAKQLAESQNRVASAKRAASVNVPRRASVPSPAKPGSMAETITDTARELGLIT